jgi:quinol-cytochrome oxidoreductase complex cytochrome b subunit
LGVLLGILLLGSAFTGSILPWDIRSFAAAEVAAGTVENSIPLLGQYCAAILRGGDSVGEATLRRAYVLHIAWLPIAIAILIFITAPWKWKASTSAVVTRDSTRTLWYAAGTALALVAIAIETGWLILKDPIIPLAVVTILVSLTGLLLLAISPQAGKRPVAEIWGHLLCWLLATGAFVTMATVNPPNRLIPMVFDMPTTHNTESLHPEWYLMFGYGALQSLSSGGALLMLTAVALLMLLSPSLEKRFGDGSGKIFRLAGIVSFGVLVVLTVWGLLIPSGISLCSLPPPL